MNLTTIFNLFIREFRKQKKRITLTLVALSWGTISIMLLLAFGEGLHRQMSLNRKGMGNNIGVMWSGQTTKAFKGMGKGRPIQLLKEDPQYLLDRIPELKYAGGEYSRWSQKVKYKDKVLNQHISGVPPIYEIIRYHIPQEGGRMINQRDMEERRRVAFLGNETKENLFGDEDPIGKRITINDIPFTVVGVMIEKIQMGNYGGMDADRVVIPATTFHALFGDAYLDDIVYQPRNPDQMPLIEKKIYEAMGAKYRFDPTDDRALSIWDTVSMGREFNNMMLGIKVFLGIIGSLTLLIAGVGVANIMYVSIKERTREIGIKMAVGAKKSLILFQFLIEAILITFIGGSSGMLIAYGMTEAFKRVPLGPESADIMEFMGRPTVSMEVGVTVVIILGTLGLLAGLFPAMKAASTNPVESLRYE